MTAKKTGLDEQEQDYLAMREARQDHAIALLKEYFKREDCETPRQRARFAKACGTTWGNLQQISQKQRTIPFWLAVNLDRESNGELPLTEMCTDSIDQRHAIDWAHLRKAMRRKPTKA